jgi:hypothetical protein
VTLYEEKFEATSIPEASWSADTHPDDGPFSDNGVYFQRQGVSPPAGYRASAAFGADGWLTLSLYSRSSGTAASELASVTDDPSGAQNRVLRIRTPQHTDGAIVRSTDALPDRYRISLRVGFPWFGDGAAGANGYDGGESAGPWLPDEATHENGFYWLAILDALPRPHNNVWIHHHRKVVIDSDNHYPPWMEIYDGSSFIPSGVHPVMMFVVDGQGDGYELSGKPFRSWAAGQWQPSGEIRAADAYKPGTWYRVLVERDGQQYTIEVSGDFAHGGQQTYRATIDPEQSCVWHYNTSPLAAGHPCVDTGHYASLDSDYPHWPAGQAWPDHFMFGDPHINYYEGRVYYDDIKLEVWQ